MSDESKSRSKSKSTRSYTLTLPAAVSDEIRQVAADLGLPSGTVRGIVVADAVRQIEGLRGKVRAKVAEHFASMAAKGA